MILLLWAAASKVGTVGSIFVGSPIDQMVIHSFIEFIPGCAAVQLWILIFESDTIIYLSTDT
jgi:hypothetical protein